MSDYRVTLKVRNANLLRAIEKAGHAPGAKFAELAGIQYLKLNALVNMTQRPVDACGDLTPTVEKICAFLNRMPHELFSFEQMHNAIDSNSAEFDIDADGLAQISRTSAPNVQGAIDRALESLPPRKAEVLRMRFGIDCDPRTLQEIGDLFGVSKDRVRQIEADALRSLRHPTLADPLKLVSEAMA